MSTFHILHTKSLAKYLMTQSLSVVINHSIRTESGEASMYSTVYNTIFVGIVLLFLLILCVLLQPVLSLYSYREIKFWNFPGLVSSL